MEQQIKARLEELRRKVAYHAKRYYVYDDPEISDFEYDRMYAELLKLEEAHPELDSSDSPTKRVGGKPLDKFEKVVHSVQMNSLSDVFSYDAVLHLLQRIRDEAHRFAISYHRSLHQRNALLSVLDGIEGIGDTRKRALFDAFITRDAIAGASVEDLSKVKGMSRPAAEAVYRFFHPADDINDTEKKG